MKSGDVVIVPTGQCGTIFGFLEDGQVMVILRSLEMWTGMAKMVRPPFDQEEQDNAPIEVPRFDPVFQKFGKDY